MGIYQAAVIRNNNYTHFAVEEYGNKDLSSLDDFSGHHFMKKLEAPQLEHWARMAVSPKKKQVKADVDDAFNVTFSRPNRFSGKFQVTIRTEGEPEIINLGTEV